MGRNPVYSIGNCSFGEIDLERLVFVESLFMF